METQKRIPESDILTPQEHVIMGSTPSINVAEVDKTKWYIPEGVINGTVTIADVVQRREELNSFESSVIGFALGFDKPIKVRLQAIDEETGQTVDDPKILVDEVDVTEEAYRQFKQMGMDLHLREKRSDPEVEMIRRGEVE